MLFSVPAPAEFLSQSRIFIQVHYPGFHLMHLPLRFNGKVQLD